jgi:hypothetical protein
LNVIKAFASNSRKVTDIQTFVDLSIYCPAIAELVGLVAQISVWWTIVGSNLAIVHYSVHYQFACINDYCCNGGRAWFIVITLTFPTALKLDVASLVIKDRLIEEPVK